MTTQDNRAIFITGLHQAWVELPRNCSHRRGGKSSPRCAIRRRKKNWAIHQGIALMALDVTDPHQIESVAEQVVTSGGVDVVFNNAGYGLAGALEGLTDDQIVRLMNTNMLGTIRTTKAFVPHFREKRAGLFINTTSLGGLVAFPFNSIYHATSWRLKGGAKAWLSS
jgi:NADP-dependent 3-hydroxy acid dehydrogenase YdfG